MPSEKNAKGGSGAGIIFSVLAVVLAVLGGWFWSTHRAEPGAAAPVRSTLHLETFVLNLADPGQRSYLRVGIDLGLGREIGKDESAPVAEVRDTILGVLSEARVDDLQTAKGKAKLKQDLLQALQQRVPELVVEDVYFTEFLIQR
ncbi:MAG: flagellar basal body-associated FliL family protein [Candidatus Sulfotelmatobacter sp.]